MPATQVRQIQVNVNTSGNADLKAIANSLGQISQSAVSLRSGLSSLQAAFASYYAILKVGQITAIADEITNLQSRLKILSGSTEEATLAFTAIQQIANDTRSSITAAGSSYSRLAAVLHDAGASTEVLTSLTTTLLNTFRLSGSSSEEAKNATIQFAQGLAIGVLRGQDLRSVLQQNALYGEILAKSLHVTRGALLELASEGKITAKEALKALFNASSDVNEKAKEMTHTFADSFTLAMNSAQVAVGGLNKELGASSAFYTATNYLISKLPLLGELLLGLATLAIPALVGAIGTLTTSIIALVASNPFTAFAAVVAAALFLIYKNATQLNNAFLEVTATLFDLTTRFLEFIKPVETFTNKLLGLKNGSDIIGDLETTTKAAANTFRSFKAPEIVPEPKKIEASKTAIDSFLDKLPKAKVELAKLKDILGELNTKLLQGKITFNDYNDALGEFDLMKLNREFAEGKTELEKYRLNAIAVLEVINQRAFNTGKIDLQAYNDEVKNLKIDELRVKFQAGKISLAAYNEELLKTRENFRGAYEDTKPLQVGIQNYLNSVGTFATGIASVVTSAFGHLEDTLVSFVKNGKASFADLTTAILDDLLKIIIRAAVIQPIAGGILSGLQGAGSSSIAGKGTTFTGGDGVNSNISSLSAKGNVFDGGLKKFATGGIVNSPTLFKYGSGSNGLMGEAGPEAIVPLSRGSGGKLGVQASLSPVTVNIINQANVDVSTTETTDASGGRVIETLIRNKVSESISNGSFDKAFKNSFGIQRKGS